MVMMFLCHAALYSCNSLHTNLNFTGLNDKWSFSFTFTSTWLISMFVFFLAHRRSGFGFPGRPDGYFRGWRRGVARRSGSWYNSTHHHYKQQCDHLESWGQGYEEMSPWWSYQQGKGQGEGSAPPNSKPDCQWELRAVCQATDTHVQPVGTKGRSSHQSDTHSQCCLLTLFWAGGQWHCSSNQQQYSVWSGPLFVHSAGGGAWLPESWAEPYSAFTQHQCAFWFWPLKKIKNTLLS